MKKKEKVERKKKVFFSGEMAASELFSGRWRR